MGMHKGVLIMVSELVTTSKLMKEGKGYISRLLKEGKEVFG